MKRSISHLTLASVVLAVVSAGLLALGSAETYLKAAELGIAHFNRSPDGLPVVVQGPRDVPVIAKADVVVVGGGVAGVMAALRAAEDQRSVILIEERNYFGYELTATERPASDPFLPVAEFPMVNRFFRTAGKSALSGQQLNVLGLKNALHDLAANTPWITPYLYSLCSGAVICGDRVGGVVIVNRSGRQILLAKAVVDATADARVAASAGARFLRGLKGPNVAHQTIRVRCESRLDPGELETPDYLGLHGNRLAVHGRDGRVLELALDVIIGEDAGRDISQIQADSRQTGRAALDYLDSERNMFTREGPGRQWYSFAPEVFLSRSPVVDCRQPLPDEPFLLSALAASDAHLPKGVQGLVIAGRTVSSATAMNGLQALLCSGEQAGRTAVVLAAKTEDWFDTRPAAKATVRSSEGARVEEILHGPDPSVPYPSLRQGPARLPIVDQVDVLVVGGGTSGAPAAIAAGRQGVKTALVELLPNLGGTATNRVNGYYWGVTWQSKLTEELDAKTGVYQGAREKRRFDGEEKKVVLQELATQAGVQIRYRAIAAAVVMDGSKVTGVVIEGPGGRQVIQAKVVIDATGHGDVAAMAGASFAKGRASDGLMNEMDRRGLRDPTNVEDITSFLMRRPSGSIALNVRESRLVTGDYVLTFADVIHGRTFPDTVCRWRSNYDTHFPTSANMSDAAQDWVGLMGLWRYPLTANIPYRSILPRGIDNLLVVGKSYSTDHDASIGGRMQADLQHLGEAAGVAAAMAARQAAAPRQIDLEKLQRELVRVGVLRDQDPSATYQPPRASELAEAAAQLGLAAGWDDDPDRPREFGGPVREAKTAGDRTPEAMRKLYLAGEQSVALLRPLLQSSEADVRADAALVLGMLGDRAAIPELLRCLKSKYARTHTFQLEGCSWRSSLPMYYASIILLGRLQEKQAAPLLVELISNPRECPPYLASFVIVALERIGDPSTADAIRPYLKAGSLAAGNGAEERDEAWRQNEMNQFEIRYGVRTNAARALACLGDLSGAPTLIDMLDEDSALVRDYAQRLLEQIAGERFGKDQNAWTRWWKKRGSK